MRYKWLLIALFLFLWPPSANAADRVLIIDDAIERSNDSLRLEEIIRSYRSNVDVELTSTAVNHQMYDAIFLFGNSEVHLPEAVEEALMAYEGKIIVIGRAPSSRKFWKEWAYGEEVEVLSLLDEPLQKPLPVFNITPPADARIIVKGERYEKEYPYVIERGHHYAIASTKIEGMKQLALHHLLEQLFPIERGHEAYIRLTDINANTDIAHLEDITSYLMNREIPILLTVEPKAKTTSIQMLGENKPLVKLLTKLQSDGARIIVKSDKSSYDKNIRLLVNLSLYPIGVETNSQSLTYEDHQMISRHSSFYFGKQVQQILPITLDGINRYTLYPETLSFTGSNKRAHFRPVEDEVALLNSLETSVVSFSFHSYLQLESLQELVEQVNRIQNLKWIRWDQQRAVTNTTTQTIRFDVDSRIEIDTHRPLYDKWLNIWENKTSDIVLWLLAIVVLTFVLLFTVYIVFMRIRLRKRLFNERK